MGSVICKHCKAINSVTPIPNDVEGYFVLDDNLNEVMNALENGYMSEKAIPANRCLKCNMVSLDLDDSE